MGCKSKDGGSNRQMKLLSKFLSKDILTCFKLAENKHTFLTENKFWTCEGFIV